MKRLMIAMVFIAFGGVAQAGQVACVGEYMGYRFVVGASVAHKRIPGNISVSITNSSGYNKTGKMRVSSSNIRAGEYIQFAGRNAEGSGAVSATFDPSSRSYLGTLTAASSKGNVNVGVRCALSGAEMLETPIYNTESSIQL
jgi:hypothetical protein